MKKIVIDILCLCSTLTVFTSLDMSHYQVMVQVATFHSKSGLKNLSKSRTTVIVLWYFGSISLNIQFGFKCCGGCTEFDVIFEKVYETIKVCFKCKTLDTCMLACLNIYCKCYTGTLGL